jgi:hypothetical protein
MWKILCTLKINKIPVSGFDVTGFLWNSSGSEIVTLQNWHWNVLGHCMSKSDPRDARIPLVNCAVKHSRLLYQVRAC